MPPNLDPNKLVKELAEELAASGPEAFNAAVATAADPQELAAAFAESSDVSQVAAFEGYLGATVEHDGKDWCVFYLDLQAQSWLLVEKDCIVKRASVEDSTRPCERDVLWVRGDGAVGIGHGSQSVQAQFLTGEFTRAADFEASPTGGTLEAATGVFCRGTPSCCRRMSHG
jgi:hypothetical protein